jgi:acyl-CoA synthetase (AMP-forming)/AMP-acid ligase II
VTKPSLPDCYTASETLLEALTKRCHADPNRSALEDAASGTSLTYGGLVARTEQIAANLQTRGFGPGEVLALWAPNSAAWASVALGAIRAGLAVTGVGPVATDPELSRQLADSRAAVLVADPELAGRARDAAGAGCDVREVVTMGEAPGFTSLADLLAGGHAVADAYPDPDSVALLPYSSGTTGPPKGVMLTHANLAAGVRQVQTRLPFEARDTVIAIAPFAHVMGFVISLAAPLAAGARVVTLPRFELETYLAAAERERATILIVPPPLMTALARHPKVGEFDLSGVELIVSGGAPLGAELQREVGRRFPRAAVGQGYGMTETSATICIPDRYRGTTPGTVGRLAADTELRIVEPTSGRELDAGQPGELWVRGPQNTIGYLGRPDATGELLDREGWLRTGDLGVLDSDGEVRIVDRLKELIKVNALQVAPAELEAVLLSHPAVLDAAVIPRPDSRTGEVPVAVVVPRCDLDRDELIAWVAERVAPYKRLADVKLAERLPRTPAGKILRRELVA